MEYYQNPTALLCPLQIISSSQWKPYPEFYWHRLVLLVFDIYVSHTGCMFKWKFNTRFVRFISGLCGILDHWFSFLCSVQFSCSVMSDSLRPHEPQHARPPYPSSTPRVHPNPCPLSRRCHPTISPSVVPFSSCPQSFSASGSFQMSQLFPSGGQSTGVSASTSVLLMNTQDWSPLGWTGWIS